MIRDIAMIAKQDTLAISDEREEEITIARLARKLALLVHARVEHRVSDVVIP